VGKRSRKRGSAAARGGSGTAAPGGGSGTAAPGSDAGGSAPASGRSAAGTTRAERDAARRRRSEAAKRAEVARASGARPARRRGRPGIDERPPAPWGSFPLVELVVLVALLLFVAGLVTRGDRGQVMLTGALVLGSLAGLELSIREHFAGYRSHTTLLAAVCAFAAMAAIFFGVGRGDLARALILPVAGIVFAASWWALREAFKRRSGGLGFR
jgi:hypothetical protein